MPAERSHNPHMSCSNVSFESRNLVPEVRPEKFPQASGQAHNEAPKPWWSRPTAEYLRLTVSSATRHDAPVRTVAPVARRLLGSLRLRRQTPLVAVAKADLDLCRAPSEPPPASITLAAELRASLRAAYRPKPTSGGAYSMVSSVPLEKFTPRTRPPRRS